MKQKVALVLGSVLGLGYYIIRTEFPGEVPKFYQKLGFKYHIWDNYFAIN